MTKEKGENWSTLRILEETIKEMFTILRPIESIDSDPLYSLDTRHIWWHRFYGAKPTFYPIPTENVQSFDLLLFLILSLWFIMTKEVASDSGFATYDGPKNQGILLCFFDKQNKY